jgi:hypothetical protein
MNHESLGIVWHLGFVVWNFNPQDIEQITGHHIDTISMLLGDMAKHTEQMNEYLINNLGLTPSKCDELWCFVKEHKRKLSVAAQLGLRKVRHGSTPL